MFARHKYIYYRKRQDAISNISNNAISCAYIFAQKIAKTIFTENNTLLWYCANCNSTIYINLLSKTIHSDILCDKCREHYSIISNTILIKSYNNLRLHLMNKLYQNFGYDEPNIKSSLESIASNESSIKLI